MFGTTRFGAKAYANVGIETGVASASPHKLIIMLFEGAMSAISLATTMMKSGDIEGKGKAISKAISIIDDGLRASLNKQEGGEIAINLDSLYEYMSHRLLEANIKNKPEILEEVHTLLAEVKGAWEEIGKQTNVVPMPVSGKTADTDPLAPRVSNMVTA